MDFWDVKCFESESFVATANISTFDVVHFKIQTPNQLNVDDIFILQPLSRRSVVSRLFK